MDKYIYPSLYCIYQKDQAVTNNPLSEFYTQTGMYVKLPSQGRFYSERPRMSADDEIEVFPMNAIDELHFQNPDGLLNNESLVKVLQRTVPGIKDANEIPKPDLDVLLLALRVITYSKDLQVEAKCKKCSNIENYGVDLTQILSTMKSIPEDNVVKVGELMVHIKPYSIKSQNRLNDYMLSIQRTARQLQSHVNSDQSELLARLQDKMTNDVKLSANELFSIARESIIKILLPNQDEVSDQTFIDEWLNKIKAPEYKLIRDKLATISAETIDRTFKFVCESCKTENTMEVNFDPANFFDLN